MQWKERNTRQIARKIEMKYKGGFARNTISIQFWKKTSTNFAVWN